MRKAIAIWIILFALIGLAACEESESATERETQTQTQNAEGLAQVQPARGMEWSPSRHTANRWAETWEEQGKLSYVYLLNFQGEYIGYYIFEGLPVSYCASLTPPDRIERMEWASVDAAVRAAPAMDGMYYLNANCQQLYGYDAVSGAYLEFTGGGSFNYLLSDQPMTRVNTSPLGDATIEEVKKKGKGK